MTLVDTSVWIDHLRSGNRAMVTLLEAGEVLTHPFVVGELACGRLRRRTEILTLMKALPSIVVVDHDHVLALIENHRLHGRGIGWVDAHLLASARLGGAPLLTLDVPLRRAAAMLGVSA